MKIFCTLMILLLSNSIQAKELKGSDFLKLCSVEDDAGSKDEKECLRLLSKFPVDSEAVDVCKKHSTDAEEVRVCFLIIANKKIDKYNLNLCAEHSNPRICLMGTSFEKLDKVTEGKMFSKVCTSVPGETDASPERKECLKKIEGQVLPDNAIEFCEKHTIDSATKRSCLLSIVNKKIPQENLDKCTKDLAKGITANACISALVDDSSLKDKDCRKDCECVVGSYMKCPEGTYLFSGDKLSPKVDNSSREAQKNVPRSIQTSAPDSSSAVGK